MCRAIKKIMVVLVTMTIAVVPAYAAGVIVINTDIEAVENTFILDADDTGGDITLQFGKTLNKYLMWDDSASAFAFNDNIDLEGNEIKNFKIDNLAVAPTCDAAANGRLYHNTTDSFTYVCSGTTWLRIDEGSVNITGVDSNSFTVDQDNTGGDVTLQFGNTLAEVLEWDSVNGRFYFSDEVQVEGDLLPGVDDLYSLGTDTLRWKSIHLSEAITIENGDVSVGEGGFVVSFINGEVGAGNTITIGTVLRVDVDPGEVNAVELTISKNDQPIGVATNDSAYGEEVQAAIIGKGTVKCTGGEVIGDLIQSSNEDGYAETGSNSTKVIGTAVTDCSGTLGTLEAIIHLE